MRKFCIKFCWNVDCEDHKECFENNWGNKKVVLPDDSNSSGGPYLQNFKKVLSRELYSLKSFITDWMGSSIGLQKGTKRRMIFASKRRKRNLLWPPMDGRIALRKESIFLFFAMSNSLRFCSRLRLALMSLQMGRFYNWALLIGWIIRGHFFSNKILAF